MKGFILLEILVVAVIFSIILAAIFGILVSGRKAFDMGNVQIEVEQEARRSLDYMSRELRQTNSNKISGVTEGTSGSSITFEIPYDVDGDSDVIDATGAIEWSDDAGPNRIGAITYSLSGEQILRNLSFTGEQSVLANRITSITFTRPLGTDIVEIYVVAEKYAFKGFASSTDEKVTINLNTQVRLRN